MASFGADEHADKALTSIKDVNNKSLKWKEKEVVAGGNEKKDRNKKGSGEETENKGFKQDGEKEASLNIAQNHPM